MPSLARAIAMYAQTKGVDPGQVTEKIMSETEEGVEGWACLHLDCGARSAMGQAINRAFQKHPKAKETYKWLTEDLKRKFRMSWSLNRNFDSVLKRRVRATCPCCSNLVIMVNLPPQATRSTSPHSTTFQSRLTRTFKKALG